MFNPVFYSHELKQAKTQVPHKLQRYTLEIAATNLDYPCFPPSFLTPLFLLVVTRLTL